MKRSISRRMSVIFLMLGAIFLINTVMSAVTSDQVRLSSELMSDSFLPIEQTRTAFKDTRHQIELEVDKQQTSKYQTY
ncbi:hypothetical protein SAMN05421839_10381 [Halolactibacillus halophilus]|uniref:Methyl-accepting chemotaxis protein n=1 Tax=Halolactibacillus halophilus TaxID=306540 RepID=A0A1I5LZT3_9BACI|nr:hypothetical protein [Halolactibacillus halophilus]GEM00968.1 hypothetical protein HHA03_05000 [Halolactibacillus halophilus]SFP02868.1 hypothetical protein SAMN05421839_10381 [Halolactibacillus halophilus]